MLVDSHCHLDFPELVSDIPGILARMEAQGVRGALCVAVTFEALPALLSLTESSARFWASVGVHPDHDEGEDPSEDQLLGMASHPRVVAIGETGLDYFRRSGDLEWQRERFRRHIRAAIRCGKPLIIHCRAAAEDTVRILREEGAEQIGGVMHCFTESQAVADAALELGFHISFSGIVTFRNAADLREVASRVPLDRLLVETDAPYLAPVPHRGKTNEPSFVRFVAEEIARIKALSLEEIAVATTQNFSRLFGVEVP